MTSSRSRERAIEPLPPALSSMWRLCTLGYRHEPRLMVTSLVLSQLAALPDALLALWLMLLGKGVLEHRTGLVQAAAVGLAASTAATWVLRTVSTRVQRSFRDRVTIALESHVAHLQASVATIAHQERPEYLDRLSMLRNQVFVLDHMYMSLFSTLGWILRLGVTMTLLASIHPALILLAVFAVPTVVTSTWRPAVERSAQERGAQASRLARHLFTLATTAAPGKEVRVTGIGERLVTDRRDAWEWWYGPVAAARRGSALWHALAWAVFGGAYVAAVVFVAYGLRAPAGIRAAGARRGRAAIRLHRGDGRRDWVPAWLLDGRLPPARVARGLRRVGGGSGRFAGAGELAPGHSSRARVVRVPRHVTGGAGRHLGDATRRRGRGDRR